MAELRSRTERAAGVGPSTRIVAVSRSGFDVARDELAFALGPQDVIEAWAKAPPGRSGCAGA